MLESQNLQNSALVYTRRSNSKIQVFHFWSTFGWILASKIDAKSLKNASRNQTKNQTIFALNKSRKMDPIRGPREGSNEPAFHSQNSIWDPLGTPGGARALPGGLVDDCWPNFDQNSWCVDYFCIICSVIFQLFSNKFTCFLRILLQILTEKSWIHPEIK